MPIRPRRGDRTRTPSDSSSPRRPARGRIGLAAGLALALVLTALAASADAQSSPARPQDPRAAREQVRKQRAAVARNVDALRASQREVERALDTLDANVKTQQRLLKDAEGDVADAEAAAADARRRADEAAAQVDELARRATEVALSAYARGSLDDALGFFDQRDATDAVVRQTLAEVAGGDAVALADRLRAAREDLKAEEAAASAAAQRADDKRRAVEQRIAELRDAQEEAEAFADRLESRLDAALSEAASLAQLDATYSRQIEEQTRALARRLAARPPRAPRNVPVPAIDTDPPLRTVNGITVHASIAGQVERLIAAAADAGFNLTGGGYRSPAGQIAVRRENCGGSTYAIYQMPASRCRPPTARPGSSMHERGLAIDFQCNGALITSRSNPCFRWLAANAAGFGLYNLPSEPWHWSTNGT